METGIINRDDVHAQIKTVIALQFIWMRWRKKILQLNIVNKTMKEILDKSDLSRLLSVLNY